MTNNANLQIYMKNFNKLLYPDLSYVITGICFNIHNNFGRYLKEKQYADLFEQKLNESSILYKREWQVDRRNRIDFIVDNKIILEFKSKVFIEKCDYFQIQRYLQLTNLKLGMIINFRDKYLKCKRVIKVKKYIPLKFK